MESHCQYSLFTLHECSIGTDVVKTYSMASAAASCCTCQVSSSTTSNQTLLTRQVLQHSGQVHWGASTHTCGVLALLQVPVYIAAFKVITARLLVIKYLKRQLLAAASMPLCATSRYSRPLASEVLSSQCSCHAKVKPSSPCDTADGELQAGLGRLADGLLGGLSFAAARHGGWQSSAAQGGGGGDGFVGGCVEKSKCSQRVGQAAFVCILARHKDVGSRFTRENVFSTGCFLRTRVRSCDLT